MPTRHTARNQETGQEVSFDWNGEAPPTDAELDEIFADAAQKNPAGAVPVHPMATAIPRTLKFAREHAPAIGATIGGVAGLATAPAWVPAAAAGLPLASVLAGLLGAGGRGAQIAMDASEGKLSPSMGQDALDMGVEGVAQGAMNYAGGRLADAASRIAGSTAMRGIKGALKMDRGALEKMAGAKTKGINAIEDEIAQDALEFPVGNPLKRAADSRIRGLNSSLKASRKASIAAAPNVPTKGGAARVLRAVNNELKIASRGDAPQGDIAAVRNFIKELKTSPNTTSLVPGRPVTTQVPSAILDANGKPIMHTVTSPGPASRVMRDLTPQEEAEALTAGNARLRDLLAGRGKNAEVNARRAANQARKENVDTAAKTEGVSDLMRRGINLEKVSSLARRRASATNPLSFGDIVSLSLGNPVTTIASALMKPRPLAAGARLLHRTGKSLQDPASIANVLRQLLSPAGASAAVNTAEPDE